MSSQNTPPSSPERYPKNPDEIEIGKKKEEETGGANFRTYTSKPNNTSPPRYDALTEYIKKNPKDAIAYILMVISLLMILFNFYTDYANLIAGIIFGLYFADELAFLVTNVKSFVEEYELVKTLVLGASLLVLCIQVPLFFIGAAIITGIKILWPESKNKI